MNINEFLKDKIKLLPNKPGIYQYFDKNGKIIYIGKAKDLKKRVSSYFTKTHQTGKTEILVKKIVDIKYFVVDSELDALLLENNLIKKYKPRYNILLKDDKTYPWICIKKERFPRVFSTRKIIKDGSDYFGPYANAKMMYSLLSLFKDLYPLRTCQLDLSPKKIEEKKYKVCLEYHIGNCLGPCINKQKEEDYIEYINEIKGIIKGNIRNIILQLKELMIKSSNELKFENAQIIKEKIELLQSFYAKSTVVSPNIHHIDVITLVEDENSAFVNYFKIMNGAIIQGHTVEVIKKLDETQEDILSFVLIEMRDRFGDESKEVLCHLKLNIQNESFKTIIPLRGDKKSLIELSLRNAKYFMLEKHKQENLKNPETQTQRILNTIQKDLRLKKLPNHIECFDNSNFQGTNAVAACVVFKNGKPSPKDYRHFNIKTVEGPNDFASMEEVVFRRYKRLLEENQSLPQLIIIDGGKGQLSSAVKSLEKLNLKGEIAIVGIAKKLEEIFFPGDSVPIYIDKRSESLRIIQHLRNEAHRFGITHHRNKRSKNAFDTELTKIKNIGEKTAQILMNEFKSVKRIKEASFDEIVKLIGQKKAEIIHQHFQG